MGVSSLPKTVTRQRRGCDLNPGLSAPESSMLTTRLPSHPSSRGYNTNDSVTVTSHCYKDTNPANVVSIAGVTAHEVHQVGTEALDGCQVVTCQSVELSADVSAAAARVNCKHTHTPV